MKKLFASVSYTFENFYDNLNPRGQVVFSIIMILLISLIFILIISYIIQGIKNKKHIKDVLQNNKSIEKNVQEKPVIEKTNNKNEVENIAASIENAINSDRNIDLTKFEEDQEKTAIISIDELMEKAKELEMLEDEETGINYMEKYNLEPAEVNSLEKVVSNETESRPIKSFKVSQVISPIYGVKKEVVNKK